MNISAAQAAIYDLSVALAKLAEALDDQAEATKERTAIQSEPPADDTPPPPAPTVETLRALLGTKAKAGKTADCVRIMAGRKVGELTAEELTTIYSEVEAL